MSWEFLKGDAIRLTFVFKDGDGAYDDSGATKLRVFCYGNKGKTYFFGDEFSKNDGEWIAQFESERTSGNAGASILTAQLLDADGNLINSANINLLVIESNTTTPFVSSPHFKDDALAEIEQAVADAKIEIDNWSDQSSRLANLEASTQALQIFKSNSGALHFVGNSTATASKAIEINPNCSRVFRFKMTKADFGKFTSGEMLYFDGVYNGATDYGLAMRKYFGNNSTTGLPTHVHFYFYYKNIVGDNVQLSIAVGNNANFEKIFDGNFHNIAMIVSSDTQTNFKIYLDGSLIGSTTGALFNTFTATKVLKLQSRSGNNAWKDVYAFNFDMSAADAPYTLTDYQQGKPIPVECLDTSAEQRVLLALENYTITNGTTKQIFDYSGNANDATCSGSVKGDNDNRVQRLVDFIKA